MSSFVNLQMALVNKDLVAFHAHKDGECYDFGIFEVSTKVIDSLCQGPLSALLAIAALKGKRIVEVPLGIKGYELLRDSSHFAAVSPEMCEMHAGENGSGSPDTNGPSHDPGPLGPISLN
jgi:Cu/Zn superoxide dismutase